MLLNTNFRWAWIAVVLYLMGMYWGGAGMELVPGLTNDSWEKKIPFSLEREQGLLSQQFCDDQSPVLSQTFAMPQALGKRVEKSIGWMEIQTQTPWKVLLRRLMLVLNFELERLEWGDVATIRVLSSARFPTLSFYPSQKTLPEGKQNNFD